MSEPSSTQFQADRLEFLTVLGLAPPVTEDDVKQAYLDKCKIVHPDHGGDVNEFKRLQEAFEQATEYARFKASRMHWLSRWVEQYAEQEQVIEQIKVLGGSVEIKSSDPLTRSIGPDFATVLDKVVGIRLSGPKIDDGVVLQLTDQRRMLAGLRKLALVDTAVTYAGLLQLRTFETLRHLDLSGTKVDPVALDALLRELGQLESIVLENTGIGWSSRMKLRLKHRGLTIT
ncbi:MAG: J domain-containing protein [Pirellulales bacterium]